MTDIRPKIHSSLTILELGSGIKVNDNAKVTVLSQTKRSFALKWPVQDKSELHPLLHSERKCTLALIDKFPSS